MKNQNYTLRSEFDIEEDKRLQRETQCPHAYWATKCGGCGKYLASDHHVNFHTSKSFKDKNKVAIYLFKGSQISSLEIERLKELRQDYDQIIMLVDTFEQWELCSEIKGVWRVSYEHLATEVRSQVKYREASIEQLDLILYPDTNTFEIQDHLHGMRVYYRRHNLNIITK